MALHFGAFQAKAAQAVAYEKREEPTIKSVADALDKIATAFDEYKKTNDARIKAVEAKQSTADFDAKLDKINVDFKNSHSIAGTSSGHRAFTVGERDARHRHADRLGELRPLGQPALKVALGLR